MRRVQRDHGVGRLPVRVGLDFRGEWVRNGGSGLGKDVCVRQEIAGLPDGLRGGGLQRLGGHLRIQIPNI